ncbi:MAG TPA: phosphoribosylanthranilate isomerase [Nitrospiraceae bacterium]|nr:phosphoribosylanthranilate isomerase [Nitrospiraceae bacterium]
MIRIKICGITNLDDAMAAAELGADALGFNFYPESPRFIAPEKAAEIIYQLPPFILTVGIFVNEPEEKVREIHERTGIQVFQFHGDESPEFCERFERRVIKVFRVKDKESLHSIMHYKASAFLLDSHKDGLLGGTGVPFDWDLAQDAARYRRVILAGGLTPENVGEAIRRVKPYGVDVAGGVEKEKGIKDDGKIKKFIAEVRKARRA